MKKYTEYPKFIIPSIIEISTFRSQLLKGIPANKKRKSLGYRPGISYRILKLLVRKIIQIRLIKVRELLQLWKICDIHEWDNVAQRRHWPGEIISTNILIVRVQLLRNRMSFVCARTFVSRKAGLAGK